MSEELNCWDAFEGYIGGLFAPEDAALTSTREETEKGGLPSIAVSASEGKFLWLLATTIGAKRILEIGTLGGYSAIWLARALPAGGKLISLELDPHHAEVAQKNMERAGLGGQCEVRVGPAADSLRAMTGEEPFDLVFIDANKDGYPEYLELSYPLTREGGLILADNTLNEQVLDPDCTHGAALYNKALSFHAGLDSVIVPISGKGINGLSIGRKRPV